MSRCILITGATGAIGGALAYEYAMLDVVLLLQGRNEKRLEELAKICRDQGATVVTHVVDLRDQTALFAWIKEISSYPLDLVIVNAGMNTHIGAHGEAEPWMDVEAILDINLKAAIAITQGVLPSMREKKKGQIALVSSLAAYFGLPVTPTYCASKAGLKAYGEALRGWLAPEGIKINVIMPGYIQSPMCDEMPGPKPFLWTPKQAAKAIRKGLEKDKARISFPFPLNFGTWWLAVLPASLSGRIVAWLGYRG